MRVSELQLPGLRLIEPCLFRDRRGQFLETWSEHRYRDLGIPGPFVQDNVSVSREGVLRGLHYQWPHAQGKLVTVLAGAAYDVAVDLRPNSPTFGRWAAVELSGESGRQLYIPEGFAHGFVVLSAEVVLSYKCTDYYHPEAEGTILWNDPELGIEWPIRDPLLSDKDRAGLRLRDVPADRLPGAPVSA